MGKFFGTDGIRQVALRYPLTPDGMIRIGTGIAEMLAGSSKTVIIGRDTRETGFLLQNALTSSLLANGVNVLDVGVVPTPCISYLTKFKADLGIMISASHNPFYYNGIKFFNSNGSKINDVQQSKIEELLNCNSPYYMASECLGKASLYSNAEDEYYKKLKHTIRGTSLQNMRIVVDCANGAAYKILPRLLADMQADVISMNTSPNGININDCNINECSQKVVSSGAHIGFVLDGDADRLQVVDEKGTVHNGDQIIALLTHFLMRRSALSSNGIVSTIMSNVGLEHFMKDMGLKLYRSQVGDRYVYEMMCKMNSNLGGEQSGHVIITDTGTSTGDALSASLYVLQAIIEMDKPVSEILPIFYEYPQICRNFEILDGANLNIQYLSSSIGNIKELLSETGRFNLRLSGTEPVLRLMVEDCDINRVQNAVRIIEDHITSYLLLSAA